jgi:hypothetical protein
MVRVMQPLLLRANFRKAYYEESAKIRDLNIELNQARLRATALQAESYSLDAGTIHG